MSEPPARGPEDAPPPPAGPIRVLIVEDETVLREALAELLGRHLGREAGITVVAAAPNGREALIDALHHRPDVILTDLRMPRMDGLELIREVRRRLPETVVVVLTAFDDDEHLFAAIKAGAIGYVLKDDPSERIVEALQAARRGDGFLSPGLVLRMMAEFTRIDTMVRGQREIFATLTRREMEVLELLAGGLANRQIAQRLFLSEKTVRNHISTILGKLHANDRTEAAIIAARHGLGPPPQGSGEEPGQGPGST